MMLHSWEVTSKEMFDYICQRDTERARGNLSRTAEMDEQIELWGREAKEHTVQSSMFEEPSR